MGRVNGSTQPFASLTRARESGKPFSFIDHVANVARAEDYSEEDQAKAHVRRLLDIVSCTTCFGKPSNGRSESPTPSSSPAKSKNKISSRPSSPSDDEISPISEQFGMAAIQPQPKLSSFYDFFSFSHLTSPLICACVLIFLTSLLSHISVLIVVING